MTTLAARARTAHRRQVAAAAKESVVLTRGTTAVTITEAVVYEASYEIPDASGIMTQVTRMEFLLPQDQVLISGSEVEPHLNDKLTHDGTTYEPAKISKSRPAIEEHCRGEWWIVHTVRWGN